MTKLSKNFKLEGIYPPAITTIGNKSYALTGNGKWTEIPNGVTVEELEKHWIKPDVYINKKEKNLENQEFIVKSSKGDKSYIVKVDNQNNFTCNCAGFGFRRKCRHITEIKNKK